MNENARNTRTLIVSFVFAIMALIPLRFVEAGQMMMNQPQVLGDEIRYPSVPVDQIVELEAPYNEIDGNNCLPTEDGLAQLSEHEGILSQGGLDGPTTDRLVSEMMAIEASMCK